MEKGSILLVSSLLCVCCLFLGGIGLLFYFYNSVVMWFSGMDVISCKNPPCNEGESCLQGAGKCADGLFCNASSKCERKRGNGAYCPGIAAGDYCQSGKCGSLSTCLTTDGKAVLDASCSSSDQCDQNDKVNGPLWCGGVPIKCRKLGDVGDYCPLDSSKCKEGLYCGSDSKCATKQEDGAGCFTNSGCKSGKCGQSNTCLTKEGYMVNWVGVCGSDADCAPGNKCSGFGGRGAQCQPLSDKGESCTFTSGCKPGLKCNGLTCYAPGDPCKCIGSGALGNFCGDWDASGFKWCYVEDGPACSAKGGVVTSGSGGYWKKCTGND